MTSPSGLELLVGLTAFTLGLAVFVFPDAAARAVGERLERDAGHRAAVAARTAGLAGMAAGLVAILL